MLKELFEANKQEAKTKPVSVNIKIKDEVSKQKPLEYA